MLTPSLRFVIWTMLAVACAAQTPLVDPALRAEAAREESVPVLILLRHQPQVEIMRRIEGPGTLRRMLLPKQDLERETTALRVRAFREFREAVAPSQSVLTSRLARAGARAIAPMYGINLVSAWIPSSLLPELERDGAIAEISLSQLSKTQLDTSVLATGALTLWNAGFTGGSETVGVIDTGIRADHPAFRGVNVTALASLENASQDPCFGDLASSGADQQLHGTHVNGIVAGQGVTGFADNFGVARGVGRLISVKAGFRTKPVAGRCQAGEGRFATADWLLAMDFLVQNTPTRVINMSFGGGVEADDALPARIVDYYADLFGVTFTIAAGNEGPNAYTVGSPAISYNAITVANMNTRATVTKSDDTIAQSSSRGPTVGLRNKPDIAAPGSNIRAADLNSNGLIALTGTSMAAPHVAGAAALLRDSGIHDALSLKALLIASSDPQTAWLSSTGWGFINLDSAHAMRGNLIRDAIAPGTSRYYRGTAGGVRAALVWNRRFASSPLENTRASFPLNNLDLTLYNRRDNSAVSRSATRSNNVEVVFSQAPGDFLLKVSAPEGTFPGGQGDEPFALSLTASGFSEVATPQPTVSCAAPTSVSAGSNFTLACTAQNSGGMELFRLAVTPRLPAGFSGASAQTFGTLAPGQSQTLTWTLRAGNSGGEIEVSGSGVAFEDTYSVRSSPVSVQVGGVTGITLTLSQQSLVFEQTSAGSPAAAQAVSIASSGANVPLSVAVATSSGGSWLTAAFSQNSTPAVLSIRPSVAAASLATGSYSGTVTVSSAGAANSPMVIPVRLDVNAPASTTILIDSPRIAKTVELVNGCPVPDATAHLAATDAKAHFWFIARGAKAGDSPVVEWYRGDGALYERQSLWNPTSDGAFCFAPSIAINRIPSEDRTGTWRAKLTWNGQTAAEQTFDFLTPPTLLSAVITGTKEDPGHCDQEERLTYRTTDAVVKACFVVEQARQGDRYSLRFIRPDGTRHGQFEPEPLEADMGNLLLWQWYAIDGFPVAGFTGDWKVELAWNDSVIRTLTFRVNPAVTVEISRVTSANPETFSCSDPGSTKYFLPRDLTASLWFSVSDALVGDNIRAEFVQPDGSIYDSIEWDPIDEAGHWCLWTWIDVSDAAATQFGTWKVNVFWNGASVLSNEFQILPVDVTGFRVTRQTVPGALCSTPEENTAFLTTDTQARLWFTIDLANAGDTPTIEWLDPSGTVRSRNQFSALSDGGSWCLAGTLTIAGQNRATGDWRVRALWNGDEVGNTTLRIDRPAIDGTQSSSATATAASADLPALSSDAGDRFHRANGEGFSRSVRIGTKRAKAATSRGPANSIPANTRRKHTTDIHRPGPASGSGSGPSRR